MCACEGGGDLRDSAGLLSKVMQGDEGPSRWGWQRGRGASRGSCPERGLLRFVLGAALCPVRDGQVGAATRGGAGGTGRQSLLHSRVLEAGGTDRTKATCRKPEGGWRQKGEEPGQSRGCSFYWAFRSKGKAGQGEQPRVSLLG